MNKAPLHDTEQIILAEIHEHARYIISYAEVVQHYTLVGDVDGLAYALRNCAMLIKRSIGEYNALCDVRRPSSHEVAA